MRSPSDSPRPSFATRRELKRRRVKARSHRHRETRNEKRGTRHVERETRNEKSDEAVTPPPRNEKRETRNEERETRNEKRETRNEKSDGAVTPPPINEKRETAAQISSTLTIDSNINTNLPNITLFKGVFDFVLGGRFVVQYLISLD